METVETLFNKIIFSSVIYLYTSLLLIYFIITVLSYNLIFKKAIFLNKNASLIVSFTVIINYILLLFLYSTHSNFYDHAEANIATVSWLFQTGKPIYHGLESAERYSIPYGPMLYAINGFFLNLLKPSIFSAKIAGILAGGLSLLFIFLSLNKVLGNQIATFCSAYISLNFISIDAYFATATFWNRSDSFLAMFVALGLLAVVRTNRLLAILLSALSLGISINLKIHAILYFLPIYLLLYLRYGLYSTVASLVGSISLAIAPFIFLPQVSLNNYILWLKEFGEQGISLTLLKRNIVWSLYLFAPVLFLFMPFTYFNRKECASFLNTNKYLIYSVIFSLIAVVIMGSKQGAGMNHLIPFFSILYYLFALILSQILGAKKEKAIRAVNKYWYCAYISLVLALLTVTCLRAILNENRLIALSTKYNSEPVQEIHNIVNSHPTITTGMGYGSPYSLTFYRPILVYYGNPYLIDAASMMDAEFLGKDVPKATLDALSSCQTQLWLIPKGDLPFQLKNYFNNRPVFSEEFKSTFQAAYELREETKYYDLWFCKKKDT